MAAPPTNNAPTAADNTVTIGLDAAYTLKAADFGFADTDTGDTLASVRIETLPAAGELALDGTAAVVDQVVTRADIDDNKLTFTPVTGATGDNYASFMFKVNDGTDFSADANTITFNLGVSVGQGPTDIWSATLTPAKNGYCVPAAGHPCADESYGELSDNDFILDGTTYTVERIGFGSTHVHLTLDKDFPAASLPNLTLHVGSHSFALSEATRGILDGDGLGHVIDNNYRWADPPAEFKDLEEGATLTVKLVSGSTATTSSDATLSALALANASDDSAITISPVFASGTTSYTASVDNDVDEVTITPTVNEGNATVEYLDSSDTEITDADSTKTGQQVSLSEGANTIKVKVTAQDATTTEPYTVVVTRANVATEPGPPTGLTATANGAFWIALAWIAPTDTGGSSITGYRIEVSPDGASDWTDLVANTATTATTYAHTGLTAATTRHYRVSAINAADTSDPSDSADATTGASTLGVVNEVPEDWALKPADIGPGRQFRLMFITSTTRDATSTDIADYNTFVSTRAVAGLTAIQTYADGFTALVSTATVNARTNTLTRATDTDAPIYWVRSGTVGASDRAADDYADVYDGRWPTSDRTHTESGTSVNVGFYPFWTGMNLDGTTHSSEFMGASGSVAGWNVLGGSVSRINDPSSAQNRIVTLSPVFQVAGTVVLSSDATLSALALADASDDSAIAISPVFASATTSYTASVDNDVDEITITPTVNEGNATVEYLDSSDTEITDADSTKTGRQVSLSEGANTIKVKVTAEDDTPNTYTVVVTRNRDLSCAMPSFGTRRDHWFGTVTVGGDDIVGYGFASGTGSLDPNVFSIGSNSYTIDLVTVGADAATRGALSLNLTSSNLTSAEAAALKLHVCDSAGFDFDGNDVDHQDADFSYAWAAAALDWSPPVATRTLYLSLPANQAATGEPTITGTAQVRQALTADASPITDADGLPATFTYQWIRVDEDGTSNEEDISGEIASTYTLTTADVGKKVKVKVSFTDDLSGDEGAHQ